MLLNIVCSYCLWDRPGHGFCTLHLVLAFWGLNLLYPLLSFTLTMPIYNIRGHSEVAMYVCTFKFGQANLSNANLEGALATGNTSFRGSNITGAGM